MSKTEFLQIRLDRIDWNPHRRIDEGYRLIPRKVDKLEKSIRTQEFWDNILARPHPTKRGRYQLAYGHHRLKAARQALGETATVGVLVRDLDEDQMITIMAAENSDEWMNTNQHYNLIVREARDRLESLLDQYETLEEFRARGSARSRMLWENENSYSKARGRGVGERIICQYLDGALDRKSIQLALEQIGMSERQRKYAERQKKTIPKTERQQETKRKAEVRLHRDSKYDSQAGEIFERQEHARVFRHEVTRRDVLEVLPKENQKAFAESIVAECETTGKEVTGAKIRKAVNDEVRKFKKHVKDMLSLLASDFDEAASFIKRAGAKLDFLIKELEKNGITSVSGPHAHRVVRAMENYEESRQAFLDYFQLEDDNIVRLEHHG